ncbi:MAG: ATP-binding cassette domain-containing protein [Proteobacteria bacterium]|nr:ATP-binding cassette domain-containing protein [Pseudomonadota bacterium]
MSAGSTGRSGVASGTKPVLSVEDLCVDYYTDAGRVRACDHVTFNLYPGQRLGLVGESGSGKSTIALALMRMIKPPGRISGGRVMVGDDNLTTMSDDEIRSARMRLIGMVPQAAMSALNPVIAGARTEPDLFPSSGPDHRGARSGRTPSRGREPLSPRTLGWHEAARLHRHRRGTSSKGDHC